MAELNPGSWPPKLNSYLLLSFVIIYAERLLCTESHAKCNISSKLTPRCPHFTGLEIGTLNLSNMPKVIQVKGEKQIVLLK